MINNYLAYLRFKSQNGILIIIIYILFIILPSATFVEAQSVIPKVFSKDSSPFGVSYGNWLAKWFQWDVNFPLEGHPRDSFRTEKCS